jgi:hypothetical protein
VTSSRESPMRIMKSLLTHGHGDSYSGSSDCALCQDNSSSHAASVLADRRTVISRHHVRWLPIRICGARALRDCRSCRAATETSIRLVRESEDDCGGGAGARNESELSARVKDVCSPVHLFQRSPT